MVTADTRNNLLVLIILIAVAVLVVAFITIFANSILQVARHGEDTVNTIGKSVAGNVSKSSDINQNNLVQFNKSMTDVIKSNDRIVQSNNETISNLTDTVKNFSKSNSKYLSGVENNTKNNRITFLDLLKEQHKTTLVLQNISKQLNLVPIVPIVPNNGSINPTKDCMIKTPTVCILSNGGGIIINHK